MARLIKGKEKGFTLIELVVVVAILGVLIAMAISGITSQMSKARDIQRKSDLKSIKTSLALYYNVWGQYPDSDANNRILGCGNPGPVVCTGGNPWTRGTENYMKILPSDPGGGDYAYSRSGEDYSIAATLERTDDPGIADSVAKCGASALGNYVVCQD